MTIQSDTTTPGPITGICYTIDTPGCADPLPEHPVVNPHTDAPVNLPPATTIPVAPAAALEPTDVSEASEVGATTTQPHSEVHTEVPQLAYTGSDAGVLGLVGLGLLVAGMAAVVLGWAQRKWRELEDQERESRVANQLAERAWRQDFDRAR